MLENFEKESVLKVDSSTYSTLLKTLTPFEFTYPIVKIEKVDFKSILNQPKDAELSAPGKNIFDNLPTELKLLILSYLTVQELCRAATVSKYWNGLTSLNCLWEKFPILSLNFKFGFEFKTAKEKYKDSIQNSLKFQYSRLELTKDFYKPLTRDPLRPLINLAHLDIFPNVETLNLMRNEDIQGGNEDDPSKQFILKR